MIRLTSTFPDFNSMPNRIPDWFGGYLFGRAINYLMKNGKTVFELGNFRENHHWFKIGCYAISFIIATIFDNVFTKLHLTHLAKVCDRILMHDFKAGFKTFHNIEPDLANIIAETVVRFDNDYKIYKTRGIKSEFLQKYFPNMTS